VEMLLLRRTLNARIGRTGLPSAYLIKLWLGAAAGAAVAFAIKAALPTLHPVLTAVCVLGPYGLVFLGAMLALRVPEVSVVLRNRAARFR